MNVRRYLVNCGACLVVGLALFAAMAIAEVPGEVSVTCNEQYTAARAEAVPITQVLGELSKHCGVTVVMQEPLDETVSFSLEQTTVPRIVNRILRSHSFTLRYAQPPTGVGNWLWVFAELPSESQGQQIVLPAQSHFDKQEAIYRLGEVENPRITDRLRNALIDPDSEVREAAVETLGDFQGDEAALALAAVLNDPDVGIRESAVDALGNIGGDISIQLLREMTADRHPVIREAAVDNLEELTEAL